MGFWSFLSQKKDPFSFSDDSPTSNLQRGLQEASKRPLDSFTSRMVIASRERHLIVDVGVTRMANTFASHEEAGIEVARSKACDVVARALKTGISSREEKEFLAFVALAFFDRTFTSDANRGKPLEEAWNTLTLDLRVDDRGLQVTRRAQRVDYPEGLIDLGFGFSGTTDSSVPTEVSHHEKPMPSPPSDGKASSSGEAPSGNAAAIELFLQTIHALNGEILTPWNQKRWQDLANGGATVEDLRKAALQTHGPGQTFDFLSATAAAEEVALLEFSFSVVVFLASVLDDNWYKSPERKALRDRLFKELEPIQARRFPPGGTLPEQVKLASSNELLFCVSSARLAALFLKSRYEDVTLPYPEFRNRSLKEKGVGGPAATRLWLMRPERLEDNPLALMQKRLREDLGLPGQRTELQEEQRLEQDFGPVTREMIRRANTLMNSSPVQPHVEN